MKRKSTLLKAVTATLLSVAFVTPPARAEDHAVRAGDHAVRVEDNGKNLLRGVPQGAFVVIEGQHNPDRAFLDAYWTEVFDALKASGIGEDVLALVGSLDNEEGKEELDRFVETVHKLISSVDWCAMVSGDIVLFERMPAPRLDPGSIHMGPPDAVIMFRGAKGKTTSNYEGLVAVVETLRDEISRAADAELPAIAKSERGAVKIATMPFAVLNPGSPPWGLRLAQRGDVIIISLGDTVLDEVLDLLDDENPNRSMLNDTRFQGAFAKLPPATDTKTYFDVQALLKPVRDLANAAVGEALHSGGRITHAQINPEANKLVGKSVSAYMKGDYVEALALVKKAHAVEPTDTIILYNLACFSALTGEKDEALGWLEKAVDGGFHDPGQIASDSDLKTLRDDPRFEAVVAKAKAAVGTQGKENAAGVLRLVDRLMSVPAMIDYVATTERTEGYSVFEDTVVALTADAPKNPFYAVIANQKPLTNWDRFLPEDTVSFDVSAGIDLDALYDFITESFHVYGPEGDAALAQWEAMQEQSGFNVKRDVLDWIGGEFVAVQFAGMQSGVGMMQVTDGDKAREKMSAGIKFLGEAMAEMAQKNPVLAMMAIRTVPLKSKKLEGFERLYFGMNPPMIWGVAEGYAIIGMSETDVLKCLDTARGKRPNIRKNAQLMSETLIPEGGSEGGVTSISLHDQRNVGQELGAVIGMVAMGGGMMSMAIPDPDVRTAIIKVTTMLGKLSPVVSKIDFYKSTAMTTTFDGKAWYVKGATHYRKPSERPSHQATTATTATTASTD